MLGWTLNTAGVLAEREEEAQRQTHREEHHHIIMWWWQLRLERCIYKPRSTEGCWQPPGAWREGMGQTVLKSLQKETTRLTPWIWTSSPRTMRETAVLFQATHSSSHLLHGDLSWQLLETNTHNLASSWPLPKYTRKDFEGYPQRLWSGNQINTFFWFFDFCFLSQANNHYEGNEVMGLCLSPQWPVAIDPWWQSMADLLHRRRIRSLWVILDLRKWHLVKCEGLGVGVYRKYPAQPENHVDYMALLSAEPSPAHLP